MKYFFNNNLENFIFKSKAEWVLDEKSSKISWPSEGCISFKNFCLKYREEMDFVLKDINCSIKSQEKVN